MTTVIEPSSVVTKTVYARQLQAGDIVINIGIVDAVQIVGVFVVASVRGTVWSLASGSGDVQKLDVVWHESNTVGIDQ